MDARRGQSSTIPDIVVPNHAAGLAWPAAWGPADRLLQEERRQPRRARSAQNQPIKRVWIQDFDPSKRSVPTGGAFREAFDQASIGSFSNKIAR